MTHPWKMNKVFILGFALTTASCNATSSVSDVASSNSGIFASANDIESSHRGRGRDDDNRGKGHGGRDDDRSNNGPSCDPSSSPSSSPSATPTPNGQCYTEKFQQPEQPKTTKLDLLFVSDTSGSLNEERSKVAKNIDAFVAALPKNLDFRIAVMLAHGSKSAYSGKLYKSKNEPRVLDSKLHSISYIRNSLYDKLIDPHTDNASSGGEEGLYSLNSGLDYGPLTSSRAQGFYRADAALAVVFIADENDICAIYPAGVTPVPDPSGTEASARARDCKRRAPAYPMPNGQTIPAHDEVITPALVLEKLKRLQGDRPLIVGGILHTTVIPVKKGSQDEYGYGYMDLIQLSKGISIDIASSNYELELERLGSFCTKKIQIQTEFTLSHQDVDPATIKVFVDGASVAFEYDAVQNQVKISNGGHALSKIEINYCLQSGQGGSNPTPTPTTTPSPTGTPEPTPTTTDSPEPTPTATGTPEPTPTTTGSPEPTPTSTSSPEPTPSPTSTATPDPTPSPTSTATPDPTPTSTATPDPTPTSTSTPEPTGTPSPTGTPEPTPTTTPTPDPTVTPTPTPTCTGLDCGVFGV